MDYITQIGLMQTIRGLNDTQTSNHIGQAKQNYYRKKKNRTFSVDELRDLADTLGFDMEIVFTDRETGKKI